MTIPSASVPAVSALQAVSDDIGKAGRYLTQSLRLMVGVPRYDTYLAHRGVTHPGEAVMSYEEFFRERQAARYGGGQGRVGRCC